MTKLFVIPAALGLLTFAAAAQDEHAVPFEKMAAQVKMMSLQGGVMGKTIKGAPYSAVEVNESTQMLADGTRIHNETQTQVYRDSEGRMRRENGNDITIWDPVANANYVLNAKSRTARKLPMGNFVFTTNRVTAGNGETATVSYARTTSETVRVQGVGDEAKLKAEIEAKMKAVAGESGKFVTVADAPNVAIMRRTMVRNEKVKEEQLGKQSIEGVNSEGTRTVVTIEAGAIGNDRPMQTVSERWFSPELQTVMLTRSTDPRNGEEVFKLINVSRTEPAPYLFQVPAGYQIIEQK